MPWRSESKSARKLKSVQLQRLKKGEHACRRRQRNAKHSKRRRLPKGNNEWRKRLLTVKPEKRKEPLRITCS